MAMGNLADYFQEDRSRIARERSVSAGSMPEHIDLFGFLVGALFDSGFRRLFLVCFL
jgi:hypothetical protein